MIRVRVFNAHPKHRVNGPPLRRLARRVFSGEGAADADCNIVFIDDEKMTVLNGRYMNHPEVTDVLSFPLHDASSDPMIEGEVYVNIDQARRQSREYRVTCRNELSRLVIHGVLHLLGYLDGTHRQKARMSRLEEHYLTFLR